MNLVSINLQFTFFLMPDLAPYQIFGDSAYMDLRYDGNTNEFQTGRLSIDIANFSNYNDGQGDGYIQGGLGISNVQAFSEALDNDENGVPLFYSILLHARQNQAENINADPEQKLFIAEQSPRLGTGARTGQIQRSFLVSFFTEANITSIPDIDDL